MRSGLTKMQVAEQISGIFRNEKVKEVRCVSPGVDVFGNEVINILYAVTDEYKEKHNLTLDTRVLCLILEASDLYEADCFIIDAANIN